MSEQKKAFVMMAYDQEYNRVYSIIIKPALERLGYHCIRQDQSGAGGYVMQNVIRNIAEADLVIADLSAWKFNVAYELGIRHALNRNGTILMCSDAQKSDAQFDIQHLEVYYYDAHWMDNFGEEAVITELIRRIEVIEQKGNALCDSPVHSIYTNLPDNVITMEASDSSDQADRIAQLEVENQNLRSKLDKAGLSDEGGDGENAPEDIESMIMTAIQDRIYYSSAAADKLRELCQEQNIEEFGKFLAQVMQHGSLDEDDCHNVYIYCQRFKAPMLTKIFLDYATKMYPDNEELNILLANLLAQNFQTRENAMRIANEMIGLSRYNGRYELTPKKLTNSALGAFFNVYLSLKKYEDMVKICKVLLDTYDKKSLRSLIIKNMASAYIHLEDFPNAEATCRDLIDLDPSDIAYYTCYRLFINTDRPALAYEALENSIRLDPSDEDYYYIIASVIFDDNVARTSIEDRPRSISAQEAKRYAVPFILAALKLPRANVDRALNFLKRNDCMDVVQSLMKAGEVSGYNLDMVEYCCRKELTPIFE